MNPQELKSILSSGLLSFPVTDFNAQGDFNRAGYIKRLEWLAPYGASALFAAGGTIAEAGVPGYEATSWFGMFAPAGTPAPVLAKLNAAIVKVLAQPDVKKKINEQGAEVYSETPEQFAAFIQAESVKWGKVVKESGASLD